MSGSSPILHGDQLFREGVQVYVNRSDEAFQEYMGIMHRHDFLEIVYVISGTGVHRVGAAEYKTAPGDLFIINHHVPHGFFPVEPGAAMDLVVFNCVLMPSFLDASLLGAPQFDEIARSYLFRSLFPASVLPEADIHLSGADLEDFRRLFDLMHQEYQKARKGYPDVIRGLLVTLLIQVFRLLEAEIGRRKAVSTSGERDTASFHRSLVDKAMTYMKEHATADLRLEDVAMQSFVSKHHFSRLFREVTGIRFSEHIQQLRIEEAIRLLAISSATVAEIALTCGFHDLKHFYDIFKRVTGNTPGVYRGRNQGNRVGPHRQSHGLKGIPANDPDVPDPGA